MNIIEAFNKLEKNRDLKLKHGNIVNKTDDRIIVVNLETDEIVFDTDKDD